MTRKDYVLIANTIARQFIGASKSQSDLLNGLVYQLCRAFELDNPNFDSVRFNSHIWKAINAFEEAK